jgi:hypothetical protein
MKRRARIAIAVLLSGALALLTDRVALAVWRFRVSHFVHQLQNQLAHPAPVASPREPALRWSRTRGNWQVPLVELDLRGPTPDTVTVDGNGGLNLTYLPPVLAWSRWRMLHRADAAAGGPGVYPLNDVYLLRISALEDKPGGHDLAVPEVTLTHGLPF